MCDLKKALDFVKSCTTQEDGKKYLSYMVYDYNNKCVIGTDGRRLAMIFLDVNKYVNLSGIPADNPAPYYVANYDRNTNKIFLTNVDDVNFPHYWQVIPKYAADACKPVEANPENEKAVCLSWRAEYSGTWENKTNGIWTTEREISAGLFSYMRTQGVTLAPGFLNLPVFKSGGSDPLASNDWQICHEDEKSPVVFVNDNMNECQRAGFRILYLVMPYRGDAGECDDAANLEKARAAIKDALEHAGVKPFSWRTIAGCDPTCGNLCTLSILFKTPDGDEREYLGNEFRGAKWFEVHAAVTEWLNAK